MNCVECCLVSCDESDVDVRSGGDVTEADGLCYASESTAAILMLVFQYVTNGGMLVSTCW